MVYAIGQFFIVENMSNKQAIWSHCLCVRENDCVAQMELHVGVGEAKRCGLKSFFAIPTFKKVSKVFYHFPPSSTFEFSNKNFSRESPSIDRSIDPSQSVLLFKNCLKRGIPNGCTPRPPSLKPCSLK